MERAFRCGTAPVDNAIYLYPRPTSALVGNLLLTAYAFWFPHQASRSSRLLDLVREVSQRGWEITPFWSTACQEEYKSIKTGWSFSAKKRADAVMSGDERMVRIYNGWQRRLGAIV